MLRELGGLGVYPSACKTQQEYLDSLRKYQTVKTLKTEIADFTLVFAWLCCSLFVLFQLLLCLVSLLGFSRDESMYHFILLIATCFLCSLL